MKLRRVSAALWVLAGLVLLFAAFGGSSRNNAYLALGVVFVALGAAGLRRSGPG